MLGFGAVFCDWCHSWAWRKNEESINVVTLVLATSSSGAHGFWRLSEGYKRQAQGFSNQTLVRELNSPTWTWMWRTPHHIISEIEIRANASEREAEDLLTKLMASLLEKG